MITINDIKDAGDASTTGTIKENGAREYSMSGEFRGFRGTAYLLFSAEDLIWDDGSEKDEEDLDWGVAEIGFVPEGTVLMNLLTGSVDTEENWAAEGHTRENCGLEEVVLNDEGDWILLE